MGYWSSPGGARTGSQETAQSVRSHGCGLLHVQQSHAIFPDPAPRRNSATSSEPQHLRSHSPAAKQPGARRTQPSHRHIHRLWDGIPSISHVGRHHGLSLCISLGICAQPILWFSGTRDGRIATRGLRQPSLRDAVPLARPNKLGSTFRLALVIHESR